MTTKLHYIVPLAIVLVCVLIAAIVFALPVQKVSEVPVPEVHRPLSENLHAAYSDDASLYSVQVTETREQTFSDAIYGGVVSHHLLASIDMARFFHEFSDQTVERVILIGPNHFFPTSYPALSTTYDYTTPFGPVQIDREYIDDLAAEGLVKIDEQTVDTEHAISAVVPYIAHYLPEAELVPIILTRKAPEESMRELARYLQEHNTEDTIVVASVDFSHHLYSNASQLHDLRSIAAIKSFDFESLHELEIDSPHSISVLLQYLAAIGAKDLATWQQNAATIFSDYDSEDVTSYLYVHARKGEATPTAGASMLFFGDTMLGRGVADAIEERTDMFAGIRGPEGNFLKGYDAIAVNLEGAIESAECTVEDDELVIAPEQLSLLTAENITHVGVKNNHFQKCAEGPSLAALKAADIVPLSDITVVEGTGHDIAIASLYAAPVPNDTSSIVAQVAAYAAMHENLVINAHWGIEYDTAPTDAQVTLAHALIDAGADIIIGHHPHVVQTIERYNDGLIAYSLGNFIADQSGPLTRNGLAAGVFFGPDQKQLFLFPFEQQEGVPTHVTQEAAREICATVAAQGTELSMVHECLF